MRAAGEREPFKNGADVPGAFKNTPFSIRIGRLAKEDLVGAATWYAERHPEGDSPFRATFREALDVLGHFPFSGRKRTELRTHLRSFVAHPYVIFYHVDESIKIVTVLRVLHGRMDLDPAELDDSD